MQQQQPILPRQELIALLPTLCPDKSDVWLGSAAALLTDDHAIAGIRGWSNEAKRAYVETLVAMQGGLSASIKSWELCNWLLACIHADYTCGRAYSA
jgi:hypothetical protein